MKGMGIIFHRELVLARPGLRNITRLNISYMQGFVSGIMVSMKLQIIGFKLLFCFTVSCKSYAQN